MLARASLGRLAEERRKGGGYPDEESGTRRTRVVRRNLYSVNGETYPSIEQAMERLAQLESGVQSLKAAGKDGVKAGKAINAVKEAVFEFSAALPTMESWRKKIDVAQGLSEIIERENLGGDQTFQNVLDEIQSLREWLVKTARREEDAIILIMSMM
jgi:hypothetical protein